MSEWNPDMAAAPKDDTLVLLYPHCCVSYWIDGDEEQGWAGEWDDDLGRMGIIGMPPTHWMPFPDPPTTVRE